MKQEVYSKISQLLIDATDEENVGTRADLFDRYMGEKYGDEVKGRSQFVSTDVADAVEAIFPDVMDVFTSTEDILEFAPVGPEDEDAAKQETQAVSHIFWQKNNGFANLYTWVKEALIQQNAYIWAGWVEKERVSIEEYEDLTLDELTQIVSQLDGDYEFQEQSGFEIVTDPATGSEMAIPEISEDGTPAPISVKIRCVKKDKQYLIEPFPQEDFFITPRWGKLSLEGVPCCGRRHRDKTKEDLIALGFSEKSVEKLSQGNDEEDTDSRFHTRDLDESDANDDAVEVYESYVMIDLNDDGKAELCQVWSSKDGTTILEWEDGGEAIEEVGSVPIYALTPYIIPHRHVGRSVSEQVDDIQQVNTVLIRQLLDNTYLTNYPRPVLDSVNADEDTFNDLSNPAPGAPIRIEGGPGALEWAAPAPVGNTVLPLLEKFQDLKEMRVGATRYNQGLDAESLNKTASGMMMIQNASQKKVKLIARTVAETGLRELFLGIHRDLRAGPMKELVMRLAGRWAPIDPRTWKHRTDMVVNVGMGRGDRDEVRAGLTMLGQVQRELMASGSRMVGEQEIWNTIDKVAETFGIHSLERFLKNPATLGPPPPPPPPAPDPIMISAQAQAQKYQADAQRDAARLQAEERERERKHREKMAELRLREIELTNRIQNEQEQIGLNKHKAVMDDDFKRDKLEVDAITGFQREKMKAVKSEPPVSHQEVLDD